MIGDQKCNQNPRVVMINDLNAYINIFQQQMLGCEPSQNEGTLTQLHQSEQEQHTKIMMKIHMELSEVMQTKYESESKAQLVEQMQKMKREHDRQIQALKLNQHLLESTFSFDLQKAKMQYDEIKQDRDCLAYENQKLREEIAKLRTQLVRVEATMEKYYTKIKNQENLIDEYKRSIEEQINLEKEVIRVEYLQRELQNKMQFEKALKCMEQNYQKKLSQTKYESAFKDYKNDFRTAKKLCSTLGKTKNRKSLADAFGTCNNKENMCSESAKKMTGCSSYSTIQK